MGKLYDKVNLKEAWNMVEGFSAALSAMHGVFKKNHEKKLIYPLIDLAFHTMEKIAFALLFVKKGSYTGTHAQIRNDFIKEFESYSVFKEIREKYGDIINAKDSLIYHFEKTIPEKELDSHIDCVKKFKKQAEFYLRSKGVRL